MKRRSGGRRTAYVHEGAAIASQARPFRPSGLCQKCCRLLRCHLQDDHIEPLRRALRCDTEDHACVSQLHALQLHGAAKMQDRLVAMAR